MPTKEIMPYQRVNKCYTVTIIVVPECFMLLFSVCVCVMDDPLVHWIVSLDPLPSQ